MLIDTQVLIWAGFGSDKLGPAALEHLDDGQRKGSICISTITAWEVAMLVRKRKLRLELPLLDWLTAAAKTHRASWIDLDYQTAARAEQLPLHGDPADRLIMATARMLGCALITADRQLLAYARDNDTKAIDARR